MSTIDFTKPASTDLYTAWPTEIQAAQQSFGFMLDPTYVTSYTGLATGHQRFNRTGSTLFEFWNGTAWAAAVTGYTLKAGDTMTGNLILSSAASLGIGGSPSKPLHVQRASANASVRISSVGGGGRDWDITSTTSGVLDFTSDLLAGQLQLQAGVLTIGSSGKLVTTNVGGESMRVVGSGSYISFWNTANTTRGGYLQANAGSDLSLVSENGANLLFGTASTIRTVLDASGNLAFNNTTAPPAWASNYRAINLTQYACIAGSTTQDSMELLSNCYAYAANAYKYIDTGPYPAAKYFVGNGLHSWHVAANGSAAGVVTFVQAMTLTAAGSLVVGGTASTFDSTGRVVIQSGGASNTSAVVGLTVGGSAVGFLINDGINQTLANVSTGTLNLATGGVTRLTIAAAGASTFACGVATTTKALAATSGAVTVDASASNVHSFTLNGNMTGLTLSNMQDGQTVNIQITQDATGTRTMAGLTSANSYLWPGGTAGALSTAPNAVDLLVVTKIGTKMLTTLTKAFS